MVQSKPSTARPPHADHKIGIDAMRGMAHPLRIRIFDELSMYGPLTASGLAERLEESSGATSYHLRQMEKHGLVREVADKGNARERWWERRPGPIATPEPREFPPGSAERLASELIEDEWNRARAANFHAFLHEGVDMFDDEWLDSATVDTINVRLTPSQLRQLVKDLDVVLMKYIDAYKMTPTPGSRPVQIHINAFPLVRGDVTADEHESTPEIVGGQEKNS